MIGSLIVSAGRLASLENVVEKCPGQYAGMALLTAVDCTALVQALDFASLAANEDAAERMQTLANMLRRMGAA